MFSPNRFDLVRFSAEVKNKSDIKVGCTLSRDDDPKVLKTFSDKNSALAALKNYKSSFFEYQSQAGYKFYYVTEFAVEMLEADEDGIFLDGSDYEFSEFEKSSVF